MAVSVSSRHTAALAPRDRFALSPAGIMVICAAGLAILGLTILFSASVTKNPEVYLFKQAAGIGMAIVAALVVSRVNIEFLRRYAWWIGGAAVVVLLIVLIPGIGVTVNGSRRWLGLGPLRFQVSEIGKIAMVFCLAHYLAINQSRIGEFKRGFLIPLAIVGLFVALIIKEPDLGTAALTGAVGFTLLFLAGARLIYFIPAVFAGIAGIAALIYLMPNRLGRITEYINYVFHGAPPPYQLYQSLLAFAAGGTPGAGLGQGRQQMNFLPEAHTDFIFAVIGEELGIVFTLGIIVVFLIMCVAGFIHLRRAPNLFQYLLVTGAVLLIGLQAIINLGVVTGVFPTKGMSLPFISAGMSNLLLMGILLGIILNTQRTWTRARIDPRNTEWEGTR
ncbi:FtsW/RodA/SpoVE family cell cycle protein [Geminisphaera colitermitum]|uniref:FtsW/RodA/SpoVE family cell cycle protein n=1 Tax=Geminisphaera colitermitum TaxID=1148786 RepID=UPI000158DC19|nr:putative peptidoglycan glycosyltransferase FtsW [Geminisphaera colitermitum]